MPARKTTPKSTSAQQQLVDSNVKLQTKLVELIESNKALTDSFAESSKSITELVKFFKEAGKYMIAESEDEKLKPLLSKITDLVDQNKTIMRGLILIQKYIKTGQPPSSTDLYNE